MFIVLAVNHQPAAQCRYTMHTHARLTALFPRLPGWAGTRKVNQSGFYWSKKQWVAVASAGPYASLHLTPDRQPCQHPTTQFIIGRMPFLQPNQQRRSTEGRDFDIYTLAVVQLSILLYLLCLHQAKLLRVNPLQFLHENQYRTMQCSLLDNWCNC